MNNIRRGMGGRLGRPIRYRPRPIGRRPMLSKRPGYYRPRPITLRKQILKHPVKSSGPGRKPQGIKGIFSKKPDKKSPNILIIGLGVLLFIIIIVFFWIKLINNTDKNEDDSPLVPGENLEMKISDVLIQGDLLKVTLDIDNDDLLDSVRFVVKGGGKQEVFKEDFVAGSDYGGESEFFLNLKNISPEDVGEVLVIPIFKDEKGVLSTGSIEDTYVVKDQEPSVGSGSEYPGYYDDSDYQGFYNGTSGINDTSGLEDSGSNDSSQNYTSYTNCTSHYEIRCYLGNPYWYDSCGVREGRNKTCFYNESCVDGICVSDIPSGSVCGNNLKETGESCDGIDLDSKSCLNFGYDSGILTCNSTCGFDFSACTYDEPGCVAYSYLQCYNNNVYWYDSCGVRGNVYDFCGYQEVCIDAECVLQEPTCNPHSYSVCYAGNVWWYNSCDEREDMREECYADEICSGGVCVLILPEPWETGMISWWSFDSNANDIKGSNHGTVYGASLVSSGCKSGSCYDFDGYNDYIGVGNFYVSGDEITIAAWVNYEAGSFDLDPRIISKAHGTEVYEHVFLLGLDDLSETSAQYRFRFTSGGTSTSYNAGSATPQNGWHHVVGVYDGSAGIARIYVDKTLVGSTSKSGNLETNSDSVTIGKNPVGDEEGGRYWNGKLDEIMIWNRALSSSEITDIYNYF